MESNETRVYARDEFGDLADRRHCRGGSGRLVPKFRLLPGQVPESPRPWKDYVLEVVRPVPDLDLRIGDRVVVHHDVADEHPMCLVRTLSAERALILAWNAGDLDLVTPEDGPTPSEAADVLRLGGETGRIVRGNTQGRDSLCLVR